MSLPEGIAVVPFAVKEVLFDLETAFRRKFLDHADTVLLRDLHKDGFPLVKLEYAVECIDADLLVLTADKE